ncbi:hypothetical protein Taro_038127 [Colocasia esculenta]|uniref:Uncharacterized protein n=1 Tax=Colocasia esculenta TaxID=4460 RepID=A0A843WEX5_COLES|nr:hypothetical protein [Colocasia esculenta]
MVDIPLAKVRYSPPTLGHSARLATDLSVGVSPRRAHSAGFAVASALRAPKGMVALAHVYHGSSEVASSLRAPEGMVASAHVYHSLCEVASALRAPEGVVASAHIDMIITVLNEVALALSRNGEGCLQLGPGRLSTARPRQPCESDHKGAHPFAPRVIKSSGLVDLELDPLMCPITAHTVNMRIGQ